VRIYQGTGKRPIDRFEQVKLRPLPVLLPDCRQTVSALVHKDFTVRFDANSFSASPWAIGKQVTLKADGSSVSLYNFAAVFNIAGRRDGPLRLCGIQIGGYQKIGLRCAAIVFTWLRGLFGRLTLKGIEMREHGL
jgi:hypothetical protein